MSQVHPNRVMRDRAVNRVTALLQDNLHIVTKIDGDNDLGEDLYVRFVSDGRLTGETIAVQVKGGTSYRASDGYRIPVDGHHLSWLNDNVPVVCVVYDPDTEELYWANATAQLDIDRDARSVKVSSDALLNSQTISVFIANMRRYISERDVIKNALGLVSQPRQSLATTGNRKFEELWGDGLVALYYNGQLEPYRPLSRSEQPIYIGTFRRDPISRVAELCRSIGSASSTLDIDDFEYKIIVIDGKYVQAAYDFLFEYFRPIWCAGSVCRGIGLHGSSVSRHTKQKRSPWDTLHPGREYMGDAAEGKSSYLIMDEIQAHFNRYPPKGLLAAIIDDILYGVHAEKEPFLRQSQNS